VRSGPTDADLRDVSISYVCGNSFSIANHSSAARTVSYSVLGSTETGELLLPANSADAQSTVRLITLETGSLQLASGEQQSDPVENGGRACPPPAWTSQPEGSLGVWSDPFPWPVVAVHLHLLPNGRVLSWGGTGAPHVFDPAIGGFTEVPTSTMVFCGGHTFLPDGRLFVSGGHRDYRQGLRDANVFDGDAGVWERLPAMRYARWYPTSTTLPAGHVLTLAGTDESGQQVDTPEVWDGSAWRSLPGARRVLPYYPRTFVAPNGLVFYAGELQESAYLDPSGSGSWIPVASSQYGRRDYGSAVMYQPGKVMIVGGSDPPDGPPTSTAELIDLNEAAPSWRYTAPMTYARRHLNATILPDGKVLVTGGTSSGGFNDPSGAVHAAELWNPGDEQWRVLAPNRVARVYHSTTLLLPDGRVLHAGSGDGPGSPRQLNAELFSPPYLFRGARPTILEAPTVLPYGGSVFLGVPEAGEVVRVTLVRLPSVTHAFDESQRFVEVEFHRAAGGLTVLPPSSGAIAPPGPYLLFIINGDGVPSVARTVSVR
jgi:hypothetical protein